MSTSAPTVSVLMPVHNGAQFLRESIDSILNQTFTDFEFLIIDDGSTDETTNIIASYTDPRIKNHRLEKNVGLPAALNSGLSLAKGTYIARMDADDISTRGRLETQVNFLNTHEEIGVVGSWARVFGTTSSYVWKNPKKPEDIKALLPFSCCLLHPTVMLRKSILEKNSLKYNEDFLSAQDYELWSKLWQRTEFANVPQVLLHYRVNDQSISHTKRTTQLANTWKVQQQFLRQLGITPNDDSSWIHTSTTCPEHLSVSEYLSQKEVWFKGIIEANMTIQIIDQPALRKIIHSLWFATCLAQHSTNGILVTYWRSSLCVVDSTFFYKLWRFLLKYRTMPHHRP
jgi:glycosyltransferase involved in cell wall biosynthesis